MFYFHFGFFVGLAYLQHYLLAVTVIFRQSEIDGNLVNVIIMKVGNFLQGTLKFMSASAYIEHKVCALVAQ